MKNHARLSKPLNDVRIKGDRTTTHRFYSIHSGSAFEQSGNGQSIA